MKMVNSKGERRLKVTEGEEPDDAGCGILEDEDSQCHVGISSKGRKAKWKRLYSNFRNDEERLVVKMEKTREEEYNERRYSLVKFGDLPEANVA